MLCDSYKEFKMKVESPFVSTMREDEENSVIERIKWRENFKQKFCIFHFPWWRQWTLPFRFAFSHNVHCGMNSEWSRRLWSICCSNFRHHHENMFRVIIVRVVHMTVRASPPMALFCAECSPINFCFEDSQKRAFCVAMKCFPIIRRPAKKIVSQCNIMTETSGIYFFGGN